MKLLKLNPEIESPPKSMIARAMCEAAPEFLDISKTNIEAIIDGYKTGDLSIWYAVEGPVSGMAITRELWDPYLKVRELLVYCAYAISPMSLSMWDDCFREIRRYAQEKNCAWITFYTIEERLKRLATRMGGDAKTSYIRIPV